MQKGARVKAVFIKGNWNSKPHFLTLLFPPQNMAFPPKKEKSPPKAAYAKSLSLSFSLIPLLIPFILTPLLGFFCPPPAMQSNQPSLF